MRGWLISGDLRGYELNSPIRLPRLRREARGSGASIPHPHARSPFASAVCFMRQGWVSRTLLPSRSAITPTQGAAVMRIRTVSVFASVALAMVLPAWRARCKGYSTRRSPRPHLTGEAPAWRR